VKLNFVSSCVKYVVGMSCDWLHQNHPTTSQIKNEFWLCVTDLGPQLAAASPHQSIGDKDQKRGVKLQNITSGVTAPCGIVTSPPTVAKDTFHFELQTHRKIYELMGSIRVYVFSHDIQPTIDR